MSDGDIPGVTVVQAESPAESPETGIPSPRRMTLNMGPQHPSTHGVLRLLLELDGETIISAQPDIGYLHTGIEKEFEVKNYQQGVTLTDRIDYLAPLSNNLCYCLAAEKLLGLEIPPMAQWQRVMLTELTRLNSHLVWLGTHAIDIGAMSVFLYCFREREDILRIFEMYSGQRMMTSYFRIGGLALEPPRGWQKRVADFINVFPSRVNEYEELLTNNRIWIGRTKGVGFISLEHMRLCTLPGAHRGNAAECSHYQAGARGDAGRSLDRECAARGAARPGKNENGDGSPDLSLQNRDRGLRGAGGRGVPGD